MDAPSPLLPNSDFLITVMSSAHTLSTCLCLIRGKMASDAPDLYHRSVENNPLGRPMHRGSLQIGLWAVRPIRLKDGYYSTQQPKSVFAYSSLFLNKCRPMSSA